MSRAGTTYRVEYTPDIVRDAVKTFIWRRTFLSQKGMWSAWIVVLAAMTWLLSIGNRSWIVGAAGTVALVAPAIIGLAWSAHYRNTVGKFRSMSEPVADITVSEEALIVASELGSGRIPWSSVTDLWERPTYWMIFTAPSQFNTLPIAPVSDDDRDLIRSKVPSRLSRREAHAT